MANKKYRALLIGFLFMNYPSGMVTISGTDLVLSTVQAVLLFFTLRAGDPRSES
jgi:hypothetical protein